jgi:very-short-patch-repair endonuclease
VERAINEAEVLRLWDAVPLVALLHRYPGRAGTATARRALQARAEHGPTPTHEGLEEDFLKRVRAASLPSPEVNVTIEAAGRPFEIDFLWREQRLAVELDSRSVHQTVQSFESDRAKDRALSIAGWRPVRFTWRQLDRVGGELPRLLGTV